MAAVTFNAMPRTEHVRRRLKAVRAAFGEMLDAFVSNRMRRTAAESKIRRSAAPSKPPNRNR
jgi:hypothetical protein